MFITKIANKKDIQVIIEIALSVWPSTYIPIVGEEQVAYMLAQFYSKEALRIQMELQQHQFIIGYQDGNAAAFGSFSREHGHIFKLNKLYVTPEFQSMGIGKKMIDEAIFTITKQHGTHLRLNVNRYNAAAISFYKKVGFHVLNEEDIDIGNGFFMNDYVMELPL